MNDKLQLVARCNDGTASLQELETLYEHDKEITYATFAKYVDVPAISETLGYIPPQRRTRGLKLKQDYHVTYSRSIFRGKPCFHLEWSAIDHIFQ